jgi:predicted AlkP superfamily phosphohydrolase/phosphomutase
LSSSEALRLLVLSIDGADYRIIDLLMKRGDLPNLQKLAERGAWGPVRSTIPPITPVAWTSFFTGKNPGKHGVFDWISMDGGDVGTPVASRRRASTMWRFLSQRGHGVGVFNVPCTYPPEHLSGFQVPGFDAPSLGPEDVYPERASRIIEEACGEYVFFPADPEIVRDPKIAQDHMEAIASILRGLLREFPCDVCMAHMHLLDWAHHYVLAGEMRPGDVSSLDLNGYVVRAYRLVDESVGALVGEWASPDTNVVVVSDHGGELVDRLVNLEKLFLDHGLLAYTSAKTQEAASIESGRRHARAAVRLWTAVKRASPGFARLIAPLARAMRTRVSAYQVDAVVDWPRTAAVPWGNYGQIRLNIQGRDPRGIVPPEDVPALTARIRELILSVADPISGSPVYMDVVPGSALYTGPYAPEGPDLVALPVDDRYLSVSGRMLPGYVAPLLDVQEQVVVELTEPRGSHSQVGVLFMAGPGVQQMTCLPESNLTDFAPTALYLLDEPIPKDMDGSPILAAIEPEVLAARPVRWGEPLPTDDTAGDTTVYTEEERRKIEEHLRSLGYL